MTGPEETSNEAVNPAGIVDSIMVEVNGQPTVKGPHPDRLAGNAPLPDEK